MNSTLNYTNATALLEQGKDKDAYAAFLSVVELSTQQLRGVKFVHQSIVSKPLQYEDSLALLRSCLDQLEKIAIQKLPGATKPKTSKSPPPVPPKPSLILQKPTLPPRPKKINLPMDLGKRSRGNSVSFADEPKLNSIQNNSSKLDETISNGIEEEDDDDDDIGIEFENIIKPTKRPSTVNMLHNIYSSPPPQRIVRGRSKSWVVQSDSSSKRDSIDVLLETIVDPSNLVPAQTNTGDSLAIPNTSQTTDYVPNIPAPPLLATHRRLQQRLHELETDLEECKTDEFLKSERAYKVACARQTLEKVRTLYMSAMTIPNILQFPPHLTAYQLTLIESLIFRDIPRQALLSHSSRTPHKKIVASTDFFNFMTRSIEHSILLPQEPSKRVEIINRWIKIANKLLFLNNYQTLKAIISALGTPPIQRLKRTWESLPKKRMARLDILSSLMSETDNYRKYREHIGLLEKKRYLTNPVVPFLGVFMHDITYIHAACKGNPDDTRLQDVLNNVQLFQKAPEYPQTPPSSFLNPTKKHLFRPSLHFGSTKNTNRNTTAALMGEDQRQETETELEQQLIIQYILMRSWVSEKTIDALSNLREPSKPRSISSPTTSPNNNGSRPNSNAFVLSPSTSTLASNNTLTTTATTNNNTNINLNNISALSNASSFMRFSHHSSMDTNELNQLQSNEENKRSLGGFWPFRKSTDKSINDSVIFVPQESNWSEDDEDDDEEEDAFNIHGTLVFKEKSGISKRGHNRSISLPVKPILNH